MTKKPRIRVNQSGSITAIDGTQISDGLSNVVSGIGQANAKTSATRYVIEQNVAEQDMAFRASTWYSKIVRLPAADAVREWRTWKASKDQIELIEAEESRLKVRNKVYEALMVSRHRGGSAILIGGLPGNPSEPLVLDRIKQNSIKFLTVVGRDQINPQGRIRDPQSELYGMPEVWRISTGDGPQVDIHPSRVVVINGQKIPGGSSTDNDFWGDSLWVRMADSIRAADSSASVIEALLHEAKVDVVQVKNLVEQLANNAAETAYIRRWQLVATLKAISNVLMLDADDEHTQKQITWTGLPEVTRTLLGIMAGAADIPVTRLTGEQQSGLSGSDSGSLRNYYDHVKTVQELEYTPALQLLDEAILRSALGVRDPSIWYTWKPLWQPSEKEQAEIDKLEAEAVQIYASTGLVPEQALAVMTQNRLIESESWPGAETAYNAESSALDLPNVDDPDPETEEDPSELTGDAAPRTLYVRRDVLNAAEIIAHFKKQGFETTLPENDMHVTIAYSRTPVDWMKMGDNWSDNGEGGLTVPAGGARIMEKFDGGATVLLFASSSLSWRHESMKHEGASWDHPEYQPHVTISYDFNGDLGTVVPWRGVIVLGPEIFEEVNEEWKAGVTEDNLGG